MKLAYGQDRYRHLLSHPARGAWIEIRPAGRGQTPTAVAPRKGCVD